MNTNAEMTDEQIETCDLAKKMLYDCPYSDPERPARVALAGAIEMQVLVGDPEYNGACIRAAKMVLAGERIWIR